MQLIVYNHYNQNDGVLGWGSEQNALKALVFTITYLLDGLQTTGPILLNGLGFYTFLFLHWFAWILFFAASMPKGSSFRKGFHVLCWRFLQRVLFFEKGWENWKGLREDACIWKGFWPCVSQVLFSFLNPGRAESLTRCAKGFCRRFNLDLWFCFCFCFFVLLYSRKKIGFVRICIVWVVYIHRVYKY